MGGGLRRLTFAHRSDDVIFTSSATIREDLFLSSSTSLVLCGAVDWSEEGTRCWPSSPSASPSSVMVDLSNSLFDGAQRAGTRGEVELPRALSIDSMSRAAPDVYTNSLYRRLSHMFNFQGYSIKITFIETKTDGLWRPKVNPGQTGGLTKTEDRNQG